MESYLNIKKSKIAIFLFLILNQFFINAYALNYGKFDPVFPNKIYSTKRNNKIFKNLIVERINEGDQILTKEDIDNIEKFVDETFDSNNSDNFKNQTNILSPINNDFDLLEKKNK